MARGTREDQGGASEAGGVALDASAGVLQALGIVGQREHAPVFAQQPGDIAGQALRAALGARSTSAPPAGGPHGRWTP